MSTTFCYFAYGSNLLAKRIHIENPSAVRYGIGKVENYRLDFYSTSKTWQGAPATIVPNDGYCVYGAMWEIDCNKMKYLDNQESVHNGLYVPFQVPVVLLSNGTSIMCRCYKLRDQPTDDIRCLPPNDIPSSRKPSKTYLKTIIKGGIESKLPCHYIAYLRTICHNNCEVDNLETSLELKTFTI